MLLVHTIFFACLSMPYLLADSTRNSFVLNWDYETLMADLYNKESGYGLADQEKELIDDAVAHTIPTPICRPSTYGEITYESAQLLLKELALTVNDVFYDFGSGTGKFVVQTYWTTPAIKSVGVELSMTRYAVAQKRAPSVRRISQLSLIRVSDSTNPWKHMSTDHGKEIIDILGGKFSSDVRQAAMDDKSCEEGKVNKAEPTKTKIIPYGKELIFIHDSFLDIDVSD